MSNVQKGYVVVLLISLFIASCATENTFRTLTFFFDGVPDPENANSSNFAGSLDSLVLDSLQLAALSAKPDLIVHQPYLEKQCNHCHNQGQMGRLNESQPELCYQCHTSLQSTFNSEHGPSVAGYCTECHNPHRSNIENLLTQSGEDLCFSCHSKADVMDNMFHNISEESSCTACHDPHGSENHSLLQAGTCYQCHDNFAENYIVLHGPVASYQCSECHGSHRMGTEKILSRKGQDLCFQCHDSNRLLTDDTHSYIDDTDCTDCHNPHGGEDRFIFN